MKSWVKLHLSLLSLQPFFYFIRTDKHLEEKKKIENDVRAAHAWTRAALLQIVQLRFKCMEPEFNTTVAILRWLYQSNSIEKLRQKCGEYREKEKKVDIFFAVQVSADIEIPLCHSLAKCSL